MPLPADRLAAAWRDADLTPDAVARLIGDRALSLAASGNRVPALRAARAEDSALAAWVRLLVLGDPVRRDEIDATDDVVAALRDLAIADDDGTNLRPLVTLTPLTRADGRPGWVLSDRAVPGGEPAADHVIGVGPATRTLDAFAVPPEAGERVLDVGTGSGYLAVRAAGRGARVVATDINPRALHLTSIGAALSGVQLDLRRGSLLEPVNGLFDRIVSNPPFVISGTALAYRDGGDGDGLLAQLLRGIGDHLAAGGIAQLLGNWEHHAGEDWRERVGSWVREDLDLWVVQRDVVDPASYVDTWLRDEGSHPGADLDAFERAAGRWLEALAANGVTGIGVGHVTVRRRGDGETGPAWRRLEDAVGPVRYGLAEHVAQVLDSVTSLREGLADDAALLAARLVRAGDVTEVRHHMPGSADPQIIELTQGGGYGRTVRVTTALAAIVGASDGELPLGTLVDAVAALLEVDAGELAAEVLPEIRGLIEAGMLVPA
ncbi:probable transferase [Actinomycetales bacterium JB111]|nr:probable transferase [Actinomycetales bacterium JB111]